MKKLCKLAVVILFTLALFPGCSKSKNTDDSVTSFDYSKSKYWLALPSPVELNKSVDVFYVYPSCYVKMTTSDPDICPIDNPMMVQKSRIMYLEQATAFDSSANIFAPYYRQADAETVLNSNITQQDQMIGGIPTTDVVTAFDYYINNLNNGRPFILAGHSQGSNVLLFLLSGYLMDHPTVYERMIAAYIIGFGVTPDYLGQNSRLKFASSADDYGVIVSYNTEASVMDSANPVVRPGSLAINPLTWTTDTTLAGPESNLGGVWFDAAGNQIAYPYPPNYPNPGNANARVDKTRGAVICSNYDPIEPAILQGTHFPLGVYHLFDYSFYYKNLRENAATRISTYFKVHK